MSKSTTAKTASLYWHFAWKYKFYVLGMVILTPISILAEQFLSLFVLSKVLNKLGHGHYVSSDIWHVFGPSIILYAILMIIGSVGWRLIDACNWRLESSVQRNIADRIYSHLLEQSATFHANTFGGSLVSQTNKFMSAYIRIADTTVYQVIPLVSGLLFTIIILAKRAPLFVILFTIFSLAYIVSGFFVTKKVRHLSGIAAAGESRQTGYLADSITNILAIKSFSGGKHERHDFGQLTNDTYDNTINVMKASQKQMAYFSMMNRLILILALLMAVFGVVIFKNNLGTVFLIFSYTGVIVGELWVFCNTSLKNYNRGFGDAGDMAEILHVEPEIKDPEHPLKAQIKEGSITFKDVQFTHDGNEDALFHGLNIAIKPGEKLGLVGHSGSGKTTFTRLLLRFSDIDGGEILIDNQNIAHMAQDDLHKFIGYVPQEPIMFHRSLRDNIAYGDFKADDAAIVRAAKIAHADEFIKLLPDGYNTLVGERGVKLSGGQRQRIAIARAMLKNAPILVLDEATSALDSESEILIQDALWKLMDKKTAIVIAHRLSTIQKMDRIIVLEDGEIVEEGTHKQLIEDNGTYAKLWEHQSGGFIEE